jgi:flagellar hook-basal body complex protein FliE
VNPVDAIGFLAPQQPLPGMAGMPSADAAAPSGFAQWMQSEIAITNERVLEADRLVQRLAAGDTSNLHQVLLGIERARLQFQLLTQVRNRVLEAYQDILRMQV